MGLAISKLLFGSAFVSMVLFICLFNVVNGK